MVAERDGVAHGAIEVLTPFYPGALAGVARPTSRKFASAVRIGAAPRDLREHSKARTRRTGRATR
jgi:hypothetical protein